jgi:hypothetical protein
MFALLLALSIWPFASHPVITEARGVAKHWSFDLVKDRFSGGTSCHLNRGAVEVSKGFVAFKLGKAVDTADALYKIDDQPARRWRQVIPVLVAHGLTVQDDSLANPSGGVVTLPLADVMNAHEVEIRPAGDRKPRSFPIYALSIAVERAAERGCELRTPPRA